MARDRAARRGRHIRTEALSSFSPEWLNLREQADGRARNRDVIEALSARFQLRDDISVVDLGAGTGSTLRALAPLLPAKQRWLLIDQDEGLLEIAQTEICRWASRSSRDGDVLRAEKDGATIDVRFRRANLADDPARTIGEGADLVTASAFLDLTSIDFMRHVARAAAHGKTAVYAALTYNGVQRWTPHRPADNRMASAFHGHMMRDKGFGPAAGPTAASEFSDQLKTFGFSVIEGESPWVLERGDRMLIDELVRGHAFAVAETGVVDDKTITDWVNLQRSGAMIGHTDIFAVPGSTPEL